mmetsp:Transcript_28924/g.38421  ORF Transcript_28924/g.38421 Transcript_28924/m.38421 type:complete len:104 (+) Transcript_28924:758-1069(+)
MFETNDKVLYIDSGVPSIIGLVEARVQYRSTLFVPSYDAYAVSKWIIGAFGTSHVGGIVFLSPCVGIVDHFDGVLYVSVSSAKESEECSVVGEEVRRMLVILC